MMSIKYEHLCVSDALGQLHVPRFAFAFPPFWFGLSLPALSGVSFENQLNNPTDKHPSGPGVSDLKKYSPFFVKAQHKHSSLLLS